MKSFGWMAIAMIGACAISGCADISPPDTVNPTIRANAAPVPPTAGTLSWRLPKTVLDVTATFKLKSCTKMTAADGTTSFKVEIDPSITIASRGVPDDNIFSENPTDNAVRVPVSSTISFWQDRSLTAHHNADGTLSQIGAVAEDQSAAIIGNVITSVTKLASVALGVAPGGVGLVAPGVDCSTAAKDAKAQEERLNGLLKDPKTTTAESAAYALQLADQQKILDKQTITVTQTIDPGRKPLKGIAPTGLVASILPTAEQVEGAKWLTGSAANQLALLSDGIQMSVYLDFTRATPPILRGCGPNPAGTAQTTCQRYFTYIDHDTQFREPAMIPIVVRLGSDAINGKIIPLTINGGKDAPPIAFAQFGIPRALPIKVGLFQKLTWTFNFNGLGEQQDVAFGSSAVGVKATSLLQSASTGASSIATEERAANVALSPEAAKLQADALALKAQVDVANYQAQITALKASGQIPQ